MELPRVIEAAIDQAEARMKRRRKGKKRKEWGKERNSLLIFRVQEIDLSIALHSLVDYKD